MTVQMSILRIINYGPWTLTLGSDREGTLQMLQASLYKEVQSLFSSNDCLAFHNRADEFFVASSRLAPKEHTRIQAEMRERFDVHLNVSIGVGATPFEANVNADKAAKQGAVLDKEMDVFGFDGDKMVQESDRVSIMHLDVDGLTSRRQTDSPYEISCMIFELYARMSRFFLEKDSLAFFMGGDNFMVVASNDAKESVQEFLDANKQEYGITLNCGIGRAPTSRQAAKLATQSLDRIREIRDAEGSDNSSNNKPSVYEMSC